MANLRANNLCGTGGRNAIDGSVFFDGSSKLSVPNSADVRLGSNDFTIEAWVKFGNVSGYWDTIMGMWDASNTRRTFAFQRYKDVGGSNDAKLYLYVSTDGGSTNWANANGGNLTANVWHHVAGVRDGNTLRVYQNGVEVANASYSGTIYNNTTDALFIGDVESDNNNNMDGYISNVRLVNGTCLYPSGTTFTPPTQKLTLVANTQVLACQDSDDATQEATGKTITAYGGFRQDKSEGNLLTNTLDWTGAASSYSTDMPAGWTAGNGAQVLYDTGGTSGGGENRMLRLRNDGSSSYIYQTIPTVIGQKYQIDLWYEAQNSSLAVKWLAGTSANDATNGSEQWTVGSDGNQATRTGTFNATATTTYITFAIISGTNDASVFVDDIQVKAVNPKAPKVIPPVGVDAGVTFEGDTKINSQGVMYFPTGDTTQRSRGRGVVFAGENPSKNKSISYVEMQSGGIAKDFGDLTKDCGENKAVASATRGVVQLSGDNPQTINTLEYITIATTSNSIDFGDLNAAWWMRAAGGNNTRGIFAGGLYPGSTFKLEIDYITIATTGNAADFGDLTTARNAPTGCASPTRMLVAGGQSGTATSTRQNIIEYLTIASLGDFQDFGDLTDGGKEGCSAASSTRGIFGPRLAAPGIVNNIDYVNIPTLGNASDFGDGLTARGGSASMSSSIRGAWAGGYTPSLTNSIEYVDIATTGNAKDFGDLTYTNQYSGGCSNSHGGLS